MGTLKLNANETKVLRSLFNQMMDCTGGEFGFTSDANKVGFNKNEFAGYVSALEGKGCFEYLEPLEHMKSVSQYALTGEAIKYLKEHNEKQVINTNNNNKSSKIVKKVTKAAIAVEATAAKEVQTVSTAAATGKITAGQTRILTKETVIGEKTYKAGTKFVIESIKYCIMQIKIGKAKAEANLNLVKTWASEPEPVVASI